jgi:predicted O-methyltransferase YrrM
MPEPGPQPLETFDAVDRMLHGYREAQILFSAVRLGVFDALADAPARADELATRLAASPRGTRILCDALAALGLLVKDGGLYRCSPAAREFLVSSAPTSKVAMLLHGARLYERWARLFDAVKTGAPVPEERIDPHLRGDEGTFAHAMAAIGRDVAAPTVDALERLGLLAGARTALDVGGGPGVYALEMARRAPGLHAVVLDGAGTLEVTRRNVEAAGLSDRVTLRPGDAFEDDLGGPYDLVFTSNFLHIYPPEANRGLVRRIAGALAPGGHFAVKDFLLDPDRITPEGGALFAVNMLVGTEAGDSYSVEEVQGWFRDAGLEPGETVDLTAQSRLTVGRKP